ncbi:MAG: hypothetical protein HQL12_03840 [Candidatus Omnitrophica bacterium]|nr:hypothetical protein [Candidatus Omnitrophota bacterium]
MNNKAFTLLEMLMAVSFSVLLLTGVYGFYNASSQSYSAGISGQILQDGADIVINKIIEGGTEPGGGVFRLATGYSFYITNDPNILYYCQNSLCTASDPTARWYTLDPTNTQVLYHHPTSNPLGYDVIYSAPAGSSFFNQATNSKTLRFSYATYNGKTLPNVAEIDVALTANVPMGTTNNRVAASGSASTFVLLRDHTCST